MPGGKIFLAYSTSAFVAQPLKLSVISQHPVSGHFTLKLSLQVMLKLIGRVRS